MDMPIELGKSQKSKIKTKYEKYGWIYMQIEFGIVGQKARVKQCSPGEKVKIESRDQE